MADNADNANNTLTAESRAIVGSRRSVAIATMRARST